MKININYFIGAFLVLLMVSCSESSGPLLTFESASIGAYPRFVEQNGNAEFDLANPSASSFSYTIDFVDKEDGNLVTEYVVEAQFFDLTPFNGDNSKARTVYFSASSSDFSPGPQGNPSISVDVSFADMLSAFGLSASDVTAGDQFVTFGVVKIGDQEFRSTNSTGTIRGSAFQGFFDVTISVTCPLSSDVFVGDYAISFPGAVGTGYGIPFAEQVVSISTVPGSSTQRQFDVVVLPQIGGFGPYTLFFDIVCDKVDMLILDTEGLGCGAGGIQHGPVKDPNTGLNVSPPVDINDDSSFSLIIDEGFGTGGCPSITTTMTTVNFTKVN